MAAPAVPRDRRAPPVVRPAGELPGAAGRGTGRPARVSHPAVRAARAPSPGGPAPPRRRSRSPLRRLTRAEYNNTVRDLLGDRSAPADRFPPDEVSGGFSNNAAVLGVSPLLAEKYQEAAEALAATRGEGPGGAGRLRPGPRRRGGLRPAVHRALRRAGPTAGRWAPTERDRLLALYAGGRSGGSFAEGIEVVLRAMLQAPAFLYRHRGAARARLRPAGCWRRWTGTRWPPGCPTCCGGPCPTTPARRRPSATQLATPRAGGGRWPGRCWPIRAPGRWWSSSTGSGWGWRRWIGWPRTRGIYPEFDDELRAGHGAPRPPPSSRTSYFGAERTLAALLTSDPRLRHPGAGPPVRRAAAGGSGRRSRWRCRAAERAGLLTQAGVPGGARAARPELARPPGQAGARAGPVSADAAAAARADGDAARGRPAAAHPRALRPARQPTPPAPVCHRLMDPIGFGFERYDGIGRFRASDGGGPVDDRGEVTATDGDRLHVPGRARAGREAGRPARRCAAACHPVVPLRLRAAGGSGRQLLAAGGCRRAFAALGGDVGELLVALTAHRGVPAPARPAQEGAR